VFPARVSLALILALQAVVSVVTMRNTAFQDEGLYLYAGRQIIRHWSGGPAPLDHYAYYFSGYPYVYPVIGGFLDKVGGLELARSFSLLCMLGVTGIVWYITRRLFDVPAAVFASGMYAVTGVVLLVGRLATFDALCLFLIALGTGIGVHCATTKRPWSALAIGPVLVASILAKYAALLFVPAAFALLACLSVMHVGWRGAVSRVSLALTTFALSLWMTYQTVDSQTFHALSGSTTNRVAGLQAARIELFTHVLRMGGLVLGGALVGLLLLQSQRRLRLVTLILFGASWLTPAYHIYMRETVSLDKHIAYGLFFAAPLAGYALAWLSGYDGAPAAKTTRSGYWLVGAAVLLAAFTLGLHQSYTLFHGWADSSQLTYALHTQLRNGTGKILAEDIEVARFDARDITQEWQWNSFYYSYYVDEKQVEHLGDDALRHGIQDRHYDIVELSFTYLPGQAYFVAERLIETRNYDLIARIPTENTYGKGHYFIFRSALNPGRGNFKNINQLKMKVWP
jgi:4-amino-4-deoxy-L-arabinose transferase-like glycosyltransferase